MTFCGKFESLLFPRTMEQSCSREIKPPREIKLPGTPQPQLVRYLVPGTSFELDIRAPATILFHWYVEVEAGPDDGARGPGTDERYVWFAPYIGNPTAVLPTSGGEVVNNYNGWESGTSNAYGADQPYNYLGYGHQNGVYLQAITGPQRFTVGLATLSYIERVSVLNWSIAIEVTYD